MDTDNLTSGSEPLDWRECAETFDAETGRGGWVLAVSGGPDSTAMMMLVSDWREARLAEDKSVPDIVVVTVDHGLREQSLDEAKQVSEWAATFGFQHHVLGWSQNKPSANLQEAARNARYRLLLDHAQVLQASAIFLAHTLDDQAETFMLRLARGSGVDGLGAMESKRAIGDVTLVRPFLKFTKARLVAALDQRHQPYVEDPSNRDSRFDRVRVRGLMPALADVGASPDRLSTTARQMRRATAALEHYTDRFVDDHTAVLAQYGIVLVDRVHYPRTPEETRLRVLRRILRGIRPAEHPPRLSVLEGIDAALVGETGGSVRRTACGVVVDAERPCILFYSEAGREGFPDEFIREVPARIIWDRRLRIELGDWAAQKCEIPETGIRVGVYADGPLAQSEIDMLRTLNPLFRKPTDDQWQRALATRPALYIGDELFLAPPPVQPDDGGAENGHEGMVMKMTGLPFIRR